MKRRVIFNVNTVKVRTCVPTRQGRPFIILEYDTCSYVGFLTLFAAECDANSYQQCAADIYNKPSGYVPLLSCLFQRLPMGHADLPYPAATFAGCAKSTALWWPSIRDCHEDAERSFQLQVQAADSTPKEHEYVPWVVVNSIHVDEDGSLLEQVCSVFQDGGGSHPACP